MQKEEFKDRRTKLGLSQTKIAYEAKVPIWNINQFENWGRPLKPSELFKVNTYLKEKESQSGQKATG